MPFYRFSTFILFFFFNVVFAFTFYPYFCFIVHVEYFFRFFNNRRIYIYIYIYVITWLQCLSKPLLYRFNILFDENLLSLRTAISERVLKTLYFIRKASRQDATNDIDILILIYLLTGIGLPPGGSSTVHIYTQTIHRTTQLTTLVRRLSGIRTQIGQTKINYELTV